MSYIGNTKIGKMFLGNTEIAKAYLGNDLVFQNTIPVVQYIRGGADGSYIDTGITADSTTRVIVWARNWNPVGMGLFGSRVAATTNAFAVFASAYQQTGQIRFDFGTEQNLSQDAFQLLSGYHKYEVNGNQFLVDDTVVVTATAATFDNNLNIHLFGVNTNGTHTDLSLPVDIAACKIYKNGVLVRDFTAVESPSVGLYDAVSETMFTNSGSGSFTYGTFNPRAYTPLEYITDPSGAYFDLGIKGSNTLDYVCKLNANIDNGTFWVFGCSVSPKVYGLAMSKGTNQYRFIFFYNEGNKYYDAQSSQNGKDYVITKMGVRNYVYYNFSEVKHVDHTAATYTVNSNVTVGGSATQQLFKGRFYFLGFGAERNLVPARKGGKIGMYDTYHDVFYSSISQVEFQAPA